jgi:hypothetical protein
MDWFRDKENFTVCHAITYFIALLFGVVGLMIILGREGYNWLYESKYNKTWISHPSNKPLE